MTAKRWCQIFDTRCHICERWKKEYISYIHWSVYIKFWISVTVQYILLLHVTITILGENRQTAWTMQMIKK